MLPALALGVLLMLSGCGGDSSSETAKTGTTNGAAEVEGNAAPAQKQEKSAKGKDKDTTQSSVAGRPDSKQKRAAVPQPKGEPEPGITPEQRSKATTASVKLESPAFKGGVPMSAKYTCDGGNESPPLKWSGLPPEAAELVLLALNMNPVDEALFFDWAVAGIDPDVTEIEEGKLPRGAVVGTNSFGERAYGLCPPGASENYIFMLYAIPTELSPQPGFDPLELREEVLAQSGNVGLLATSYRRR